VFDDQLDDFHGRSGNERPASLIARNPAGGDRRDSLRLFGAGLLDHQPVAMDAHFHIIFQAGLFEQGTRDAYASGVADADDFRVNWGSVHIEALCNYNLLNCNYLFGVSQVHLFRQRLLKKQRLPCELPVTLPHYEDRISESTAKTFFKHKGHEGYKGNSKTL